MADRRRLGGFLLVVLLVLGMLFGGAPAGASGRRSYTGSIDGAEYRVEVPDHWNGTVVLYSHGYYPEGMPPGIGLSNRPETEGWLLDHGYAVAGSDFKGRTGFQVEQAMHDQAALLDWFDRQVGKPRDVIATGSSMGAAIAVRLAERFPRRITGAVPMCGPLDLGGTWNSILDVTFALRTLLAPDKGIELVHPKDAAASVRALTEAVQTALETKEGRAKLTLANSFANAPGWDRALDARPTELIEQIRQQAEITMGFYVSTFGPTGRIDLERRAGGNPSWNVGVDYRRQLARSSERALVEQAYRDAGQSPEADLRKLAAEPRIAPDLAAVAWLQRNSITGVTPSPVITLHNTVDAADPANERWYADQVRRNGDPDKVRQLFAGRATHCAFSAAEEIVTMQTLFERMRTGHWPSTNPDTLVAAAAKYDTEFQLVYDYATNTEAPTAPAFTAFKPGPSPRPSR